MNLSRSKRLGIIGSSGGSALIAAAECLRAAEVKVEWIIVTDRPCGLAQWSRNAGHQTHQLNYSNAEAFSVEASTIFKAADCQDVLLFFTRRVAAPLVEDLRVWNIHPSLLPAFAGLRGVEDAWKAKVAIFGATLHRVDETLDTGLILAQVAAPMKRGQELSKLHKLSYLQKVWLTLVWFCNTEEIALVDTPRSCGPGVVLAWPNLPEPLYTAYREWIALEGDGVA